MITDESRTLLFQRSIYAWTAVAIGVVLLIPLIAMQFTTEVVWTPGDFLAMGVLLFGLASGFVLLARRVRRRCRILIAVAFTVVFLYIWAELAVGLFFDFGS